MPSVSRVAMNSATADGTTWRGSRGTMSSPSRLPPKWPPSDPGADATGAALGPPMTRRRDAMACSSLEVAAIMMATATHRARRDCGLDCGPPLGNRRSGTRSNRLPKNRKAPSDSSSLQGSARVAVVEHATLVGRLGLTRSAQTARGSHPSRKTQRRLYG